MGNWGIVEQDDGDETKAFKVVAKSGDRVGREWWYDAKALKALAPRKFKVGDKVRMTSFYFLFIFFSFSFFSIHCLSDFLIFLFFFDVL